VTDAGLLAVDVGTGSCRAVLFDAHGRQRAIGQREYTHAEQPEYPGSRTFDTRAIWVLACECIREAVRACSIDAGDIVGISATSMREGMVCYDAHDRELWACPNVDARAGEEARELIEEGIADEIYARAGDWVAITAPARFRWLARHEPKTLAATAHVTMLGDWILHRLTGIYVTDPSLGSSSGMFELAERRWSERIVEICCLPPSVLPEIVAPGTVIGGVSAEAAHATGLRVGTPVVVSGADTQLGLVGIGIRPGEVAVVGGSFWQHTVVLDEPLIDPDGRLRTLCHTVPDQWMMEGIGFCSGLVMRWFRDAFCGGLANGGGTASIYELLERDAAALPAGARGVTGIFSNVMRARHWVHASPAFIGFDLANAEHARAQCFRAIQEAAAYVSRGHQRIVEEVIDRTVDRVVFTGGAANSQLWSRIVANVLGVPVAIPEITESTALGAAMYAGIGVGVYGDLDEVASAVARIERVVEPDSEATRYRELYEQWRELYGGALALSEAGLARPLWRAAGT
jgi:autoinducer 2 (AI-2) kinase